MEIRALRGANYYSLTPVVYMQLDLGELETRPSNTIPNFKENLHTILPSMIEHRCSPGTRGGFYERLETGTWAGHIVEHVAIELQCLAGTPVSYGKTYTMKDRGIYDVVYSYQDEEVGITAGRFAVKIVNALVRQKLTAIAPIVERLKKIRERNSLGPSTQAIISEAENRGIPVIKLNEDSLFQLGHGVHQRRMQATMACSTSAIAMDIAADKKVTKDLLQKMGIPVPRGILVNTYRKVLEAAEHIGFPITIKPLNGNFGRGISTNLFESDDLEAALKRAQKISSTILVEEYLSGNDYRFLVIDGKFVAAARREPAAVVGDGTSTIQQLIDKVNSNSNRGDCHEKFLTKIKVDEISHRLLALKDYTLDTVLTEGEVFHLQAAANLSAGGTAVDVTDELHPSTKAIAERVARIIGLDIIGIDAIIKDHKLPLDDRNGGIIEVNAAPGFRMHLSPSEGKPRNVAGAVLDMLFPEDRESTIPIVAITGTNGKTTTARLISHMLGRRGKRVGMTSTDGVEIGNETVLKGDYSGPEGAEVVFRDPTVDYAVLEVARGGILRRGLGYKNSDVAIITNISNDHLGEGHIDSLEALARLKGTVTESVKETGYAVLNADDKHVLYFKERTPGNAILYSVKPNNSIIQQHLQEGNAAVVIRNDEIVIQKFDEIVPIAGVNEVPLTLKGAAEFNTSNVLAAIAAGYALGLYEQEIRAGIISFNPSLAQSPGRVNIIDMGFFKVMIDYGHNPGAIEATGKMLPQLASGRKIRTADGTGNRRSEDIIEFGKAIGSFYDHVIVTDTHPWDRKVGETAELVKTGVLEAGLPEDKVEVIIDDRKAIARALEMAQPDDLIVLQANDVHQIINDVLAYKERIAATIMNEAHRLLLTPHAEKPQKTGTNS